MEKKKLLKIYIDSEDRYNGKALWKVILTKAKRNKLAGATVFKAVAGMGSHSEIHTIDLLSLSINLPIIIEIVDEQKKIEDFLNILDEVIEEGLVTVQDIEVKIYKHR